jgi:hypothetical protein
MLPLVKPSLRARLTPTMKKELMLKYLGTGLKEVD